MKIQYCSDLHLEFPVNKEFIKKNPLKPEGDILILAGDIVPLGELKKHKDFFKLISDNFEATYWVPGNHEYYYFDLTTKCGKLHEEIVKNVFLVNNISLAKNEVTFIFSTMWSKINPTHQWQVERSMSDFSAIRYGKYRFTADRFNELHAQSLEFIEGELKTQSNNKNLVATHHVPTFMNYPAQYKGSILNEAFAVELLALIEDCGPDYWIYGHNHHNPEDFKIGNTQIITNQLGYIELQEHSGFSVEKILML